jgi:hypothetical protein
MVNAAVDQSCTTCVIILASQTVARHLLSVRIAAMALAVGLL